MKIFKNSLLFLFICIFFSCKKMNEPDIAQIFNDSKNPELDMAFYELVKDFQKKQSKDLAIVDRAINDNRSSKTDTVSVYWNKSLFPNLEYINADSIYFNNEPNKMHLEYSKKFEFGYIEITPPYFVNADKELIWVKVKLYRWNSIKVYSQNLEMENNRYVIKEQEIVEMFDDYEMEFAKAGYSDYIPYIGL